MYVLMLVVLLHASQEISNLQLPAGSLFEAIMMMPNLQKQM